MTSHDIMLPRAAGFSGVERTKIAAFLPITLAFIGVAAILLGGVSARGGDTATAAHQVDTMTTGAIMTPEQQRRALEMLDD